MANSLPYKKNHILFTKKESECDVREHLPHTYLNRDNCRKKYLKYFW